MYKQGKSCDTDIVVINHYISHFLPLLHVLCIFVHVGECGVT